MTEKEILLTGGLLEKKAQRIAVLEKLLKNETELRQKWEGLVREQEARLVEATELLTHFARWSERLGSFAGTQWADNQDLSQETHWLNETRKSAVEWLKQRDSAGSPAPSNEGKNDQSEPYFIELDSHGCAKCGRDRTWIVVGPDGSGSSRSFSDEEDAEQFADSLNEAHHFAAEQSEKRISSLECGLRFAREALEEYITDRLGGQACEFRDNFRLGRPECKCAYCVSYKALARIEETELLVRQGAAVIIDHEDETLNCYGDPSDEFYCEDCLCSCFCFEDDCDCWCHAPETE